MALSATIFHITIALSDADRGVYEELDLRVARHPSETMRFLMTRTIAYALLYEEGIAFTRGLSSDDEPALWVKDLTGQLRVWIDIGAPGGDRLHRASKAAGRVVIFTHHEIEAVRRAAKGKAVHRADAIEVYALPPAMLDQLAAKTERTSRWELTRSGGQLYVTVGGATVEGAVSQATLAEA